MEYFIVANSFAAPFFSDTSEDFQVADNPKEALNLYAARYSHPCGLYAATVYQDATAYHKSKKPLARWLSNHARFLEGKTGIIRSNGPGEIEVGHKLHKVENPKAGSVE